MRRFNHFSQLGEMIEQDCALVVAKTAFDAQKNIQAMIISNDQVDTSFMLNSVYMVARSKRTTPGGPRKKGQVLFPLLAVPKDKFTAFVAVGANYGMYQNNGTAHQPGRPFFEPGMNKAAQSMDIGFRAMRAKWERYR